MEKICKIGGLVTSYSEFSCWTLLILSDTHPWWRRRMHRVKQPLLVVHSSIHSFLHSFGNSWGSITRCTARSRRKKFPGWVQGAHDFRMLFSKIFCMVSVRLECELRVLLPKRGTFAPAKAEHEFGKWPSSSKFKAIILKLFQSGLIGQRHTYIQMDKGPAG